MFGYENVIDRFTRGEIDEMRREKAVPMIDSNRLLARAHA
jgi:hypothetical protein